MLDRLLGWFTTQMFLHPDRILLTALVLQGLFWSGVAIVAIHFVAKFW